MTACPGWSACAVYSSPENRSHADWRVIPRASPIRAQVAPSARAFCTHPARCCSTCAPAAAIRGRFASTSSTLTACSQAASRGVAAHYGDRGRDVAGGVEVPPSEREARIVGKLLEKGALSPAVAFAERVDGVDLTEVVGQPVKEYVTFQALQEVLVAQLAEDLSRRRLDVPGQAEQMSAKILRWTVHR
jgi:hypothetical protein